MSGMHLVLGRPTYLTVPSVQHVAQLNHHSVTPTPEGPSIPILFKHPRNLQGGDCLLQVPMDVPNCTSNNGFHRLASVMQNVIRRLSAYASQQSTSHVIRHRYFCIYELARLC